MAEHHRLVLDDLREDLAEVESRRSELQAAIALLEERIDSADGVQRGRARRVDITDSASPAPSMPEAILACLSAAGRPLSKRELMDKLRKDGRSSAKHLSQHVFNTLSRLSNQGRVQQEDGRWSLTDALPRLRKREQEDVFGLADCMGWDIQHYRKHRPERAHLVALLLHVHGGASENGGSYTPAQADAVLQRLIRSAPTILDAVDEVLAGGQIPEGDSGREDTTESRRQSAAAGVRAARSKYGEDYRSIPWPE